MPYLSQTHRCYHRSWKPFSSVGVNQTKCDRMGRHLLDGPDSTIVALKSTMRRIIIYHPSGFISVNEPSLARLRTDLGSVRGKTYWAQMRSC